MGSGEQVFRVDLPGVVALLSSAIYSSPRVYLRELLQNALDAVTARDLIEPGCPRTVHIVPADVSGDGKLHIRDSGIGLDEDGIVDAIERVTDKYLAERADGERFVDTYRRVGMAPFKEAIYG